MEQGPKRLYLDAEKFQFLLFAVRELVEPLIGEKRFRVIMEKGPESKDITVEYRFE